MQDQGAMIEADQQVLGAPLDAANDMSANRPGDVRGDGPAQARLADDEFPYAPPGQRGRDAAPRGFDFRKLGRGEARVFVEEATRASCGGCPGGPRSAVT